MLVDAREHSAQGSRLLACWQRARLGLLLRGCLLAALCGAASGCAEDDAEPFRPGGTTGAVSAADAATFFPDAAVMPPGSVEAGQVSQPPSSSMDASVDTGVRDAAAPGDAAPG